MQTGPDFQEEHALRDGTKVLVRHIRPSDAASMREAWDELSPTSRYRRFFRAMGNLDEGAVQYLCNADGTDHVAIVGGLVTMHEDGTTHEKGLGVARFVRLEDDPKAAEMAVTIIDSAHGKGLGSVLMQVAARAASERGIERFRGEVLAENEPMRAFLAFDVVEDQGDSIVFDVPVAPLLGDEKGAAVAARLLRDAAAAVLRFVERHRPA